MPQFAPPTQPYTPPLFKPFIDPYLTLHPLPPLLFRNLLINPLKPKPLTNNNTIPKLTIFPPFIPPLALLLLYLPLAYLAPSSLSLRIAPN
ncbi:branched-chain amino acid transport system II carrier protein, partial [Bacillus thuringiensis]|uniref:branched-chain amino acid transport system II carrier protein n=1 Tax=Bacillus thuringiensis TaxID=1428 RepID=UPI0037BE8E9F